MRVDLRDRIICTSISSISSINEIRTALAISNEHELKGCLVDSSAYESLKEEVENTENVYLGINFPYHGLSESDSLVLLKKHLDNNKKKVIPIISFDKFTIANFDITKARNFIKQIKIINTDEVVIAAEMSWFSKVESYDKICSILEPYSKVRFALSTFAKKPEKLGEVLKIGKRLGSNGSCSYEYFGALPANTDGITEMFACGFAFVGVPRQMLHYVI